jgi:AcrR family transcriptional regulator
MARPQQITDEQILTAARALFLQKGIRATTAEVARRAGVAEGSIFKRWKSKDALFIACMDFEGAGPPFWIQLLGQQGGRGEVRDTLERAGADAIEFFRKLLPVMMMTVSNQGKGGLHPHLRGPNSPPLRALKLVTDYFAAEMQAGNLERRDPEVAARMFIASSQHYAFLEMLLKDRKETPMAADAYIRGVVDILVGGGETAHARKGKR